MKSSIYFAVTVVLVSVFLTYSSVPLHAQAPPTPTPVTRTLTINGVVPPQSSDFQIAFSSNAPSSALGRSEVVTFTITYGSLLDYATSLTLVAGWTLGTSPSSNINSFDVLSYVPGSASDAYGSTDPVVNTVARTITWSITSLPANTQNQQVTFQLVSPASRVSDDTLSVDITATLSTHQIQLPTQEITLEHAPLALTPTTTRTPTPSSSVPVTTTVAVSVTPTPTPTTALVFTEVDIYRLNSTSAVLRVKTNKKSKKSLSYTTKDTANVHIADEKYREETFLEMHSLTPETRYYLKITAENESGVRVESSDFFTFTTPSTAVELAIRRENLFGDASGIVLFNGEGDLIDLPVTIPKNTPINIILPSLPTSFPLFVYVKFVNARVLGVSSDREDTVPYLQKIRLLETSQGIFSGMIQTPSVLGEYDLLVETHDSDNPPTLEALASVRVVNPMMVLSAKDDTPIDDARVYVEVLNKATHIYEPYSSETFGFQNPSYSDPMGIVSLLFSDATYIIRTSRIGYKTDERKDIFSSRKNATYPVIRLTPSSFSLTDYAEYYSDVLSDIAKLARTNIRPLLSSDRVYSLTFTAGITIVSVLSLVLAAHKIKIGAEDIYVFIEMKLAGLLKRKGTPPPTYSLFVVNAHGLPIPSASVVLTEQENSNHVVVRGLTNTIGEVHLLARESTRYTAYISKRGYERKTIELSPIDAKGHVQEIELVSQLRHPLPLPVVFVFTLCGRLAHSFADVTLVAVIFLHTVYIARFGLVRDIPFALITCVNILLYIDYVWKSSKRTITAKSEAPIKVVKN